MRGHFHTAATVLSTRHVGLVEVSHDGVIGWGEAAPFPGQDETFESLIHSTTDGRPTPTLSAAIDQAEADISARSHGVSLADEVGASLPSVPVSVAIGLGGDPVSAVREAAMRGVSRFKVKIGPAHVDHVALIRAENPSCVLGVDANGSFDRGSIVQLGALADLGIAYVEQPCDTEDEAALSRVKEMIDAPVFADESVRSVRDGESVLGSPLIDGVVVKPGRLGFSGSLEVIALAERYGKRWRASGLLETGIGRAYTDILAGIPTAFVSDVAPADWFLEQDVAPSRFSDGSVAIPVGPGLGVVPTREIVDRYLVRTYDVGIT